MNLFSTKIPLLTILSFLILSCNAFKITDSFKSSKSEFPALIPIPVKADWKKELYLISDINTIGYNPGAKTGSAWLQELLRNAGIETKINNCENCGNWRLALEPSLQEILGEEGYRLTINEDGVEIIATSNAGLFYGIQTLRQMLPEEIERKSISSKDLKLPMVFIEDYPKYSWRGTMIDVARSFFTLDYIKMHVDRMALYKLNRLHLHLTDDQGWRIEIKSRSKLTEVGARGSVVNGISGFLTQEEYLELQDYALERNIIIVPEIDLPGHVYSALVSYPELNCSEHSNINPKRAVPPELYSGYNVGWNKLCLEKPETYEFVSDVMEELAGITLGPWIHIGGDEVKDPLYEDFVVKADSIVRSKGKTSIGWEEVTKAPVHESLISQTWHGTVRSGVKVKIIESLCSSFYLDHGNYPGQKNTQRWCQENGVSLKDVYGYSTDNLQVIGVEAPVWTEYVLNNRMMDDRFWPRTIAVAEVAWSPDSRMDFDRFIERLALHGKRLHEMGIHFHPSPEVKWLPNKKSEHPVTLFSEFYPSGTN